MNCYCGSGQAFAECCQPYIEEKTLPATPEALMRSRYSAFCCKALDYLKNTTDPQVRLKFDFQAMADWANQATFEKLEIVSTRVEKNNGFVEFKAYYQMNGEEKIHHEHSIFRRHLGRWYFKKGSA
jgi:SEC-C motif-containing protein